MLIETMGDGRVRVILELDQQEPIALATAATLALWTWVEDAGPDSIQPVTSR